MIVQEILRADEFCDNDIQRNQVLNDSMLKFTLNGEYGLALIQDVLVDTIACALPLDVETFSPCCDQHSNLKTHEYGCFYRKDPNSPKTTSLDY